MMEEVNDDTNGESTFEFVGGKADDTGSKEPVTSSTPGANPIIIPAPPQPLPPTSASASDVSSSFGPEASLTGPSSYFTPPLAGSSSAVSSSQLMLDPTAPPAAAVPMYNPSQQMAVSSAYRTVPPPPPPGGSSMPSFNLMSPMPPPPQATTLPYVPPGQGYMTGPAVPIGAYPSPTGPQMTQSAFELPLDDNYVSSSTQGGGSGEKGVWGWIKGSEFLNKVAEKAKNSVDSMITTLDPGMKEIIYSGGDINLVVASNSEVKISAVREAFQSIFGKATVEGLPAQSTSIAPQPVGFPAGVKAAEERINSLRQQGLIPDQHVVVAVENFLAELTPDKWFDLGIVMLSDPQSDITIQVYTQSVPVDSHYVMQAKEQTPPDFPLGWSGYAVTIGQVIGTAMGVHHSMWHQALTGVSRRDMILMAAKSLAGMYKSQLKR